MSDRARRVRKHRLTWALAAAGALVGVCVGVLMGGLQPQSFVAESRVALDVQLLSAKSSGARPQTVSVDSEAQVLSSGRVLEPAAAASDFPGGSVALGEALSVGAVPTTRVLIIRVTAPDDELSARALDALVDEFVDTRRSDAAERAGSAVTRLREQVTAVSGELAVLRASRGAGGGVGVPLAQERALAQQLASLEGEITRLGAGGELSATVEVSRTTTPEPRTVLLSSSLLVGLAVGAAIARTPIAMSVLDRVVTDRWRRRTEERDPR